MSNFDKWFFSPLQKEPQKLHECDICSHEIFEGHLYFEYEDVTLCLPCMQSRIKEAVLDEE